MPLTLAWRQAGAMVLFGAKE